MRKEGSAAHINEWACSCYFHSHVGHSPAFKWIYWAVFNHMVFGSSANAERKINHHLEKWSSMPPPFPFRVKLQEAARDPFWCLALSLSNLQLSRNTDPHIYAFNLWPLSKASVLFLPADNLSSSSNMDKTSHANFDHQAKVEYKPKLFLAYNMEDLNAEKNKTKPEIEKFLWNHHCTL